MIPTSTTRLTTKATLQSIYDALWRESHNFNIVDITRPSETASGSNIIIETEQGELALASYKQSDGVRVTSITTYATTPDQPELDPNGELYKRIVEFIEAL